MSLLMPARLIAAFGLLGASLLARPAFAGEPTFPGGSRFGFEAPAGFAPSRRFTGFDRIGGGATVSVVELPATAFVELVQNFTDEALKAQGFTVSSRERVKVAGDADALLFEGDQPAPEGSGAPTVRKWLLLVGAADVTGIVIAQATPESLSDEAARAMLTSVQIRPALSVEQQMDALPFRIADTAGFRPVRVLAGNSILMTRGPKDQGPNLEQPILVLAQAVQQPPTQEQRDGFARAALYSNQTMKDFTIERSQSYRQNGVDWHEIVARATDVPTNTPVVVSQTIRFNPDGYLRAVGVTRADQRETALPLFRQVADSLQVK